MITRRTFIRSSALVAATLVLGGATGGLAGCASGADVLRVVIQYRSQGLK